MYMQVVDDISVSGCITVLRAIAISKFFALQLILIYPTQFKFMMRFARLHKMNLLPKFKYINQKRLYYQILNDRFIHLIK